MVTLQNAYDQTITLTDEQERCLNYHVSEKILTIKGYAGAGKSLALQALALHFIQKYPQAMRNHRIGVFTYTNALTSATREMLDANADKGGKDIFSGTLDRYLIDVYKAMGGPYKKMYWGKIRQDNIRLALDQHKAKYGEHRFHKLPVSFWEEEIDWMKDMNVSSDSLDYYLTIPRKGRGSAVRMSAADRVTAFQIFQIYNEVCTKKKCGDWADYPIYINQKLKEWEAAKTQGKNMPYPIPEQYLFDMVFIDEAQDLSLAQMLAVMGIYRKGMILAMDAHQRIYSSNWTPRQLGIEVQSHWLKKSMRNTIEIDALAESLRKKNDAFIGEEENVRRAAPVRHGSKPVVCRLNDSAEEKTFVISQIKKWLSESSKISIGIICATKDQVSKYSAWCADAGLPHMIIAKGATFSIREPGIKIVNAFNAKGLEFFRVIIPEFNEGSFPYRIYTDDPEEAEIRLVHCRSLAYVAMTRAQETLVISCSGSRPSRFIEEMDPSLYEEKRTTQNAKGSAKASTSGGSKIPKTGGSLRAFFEAKGFQCIDKRVAGGALWIVGSQEELAPIIKEAREKYGSLGKSNYAPHGGKATGYRPAWFMTADK